jgi:hypothetical protein
MIATKWPECFPWDNRQGKTIPVIQVILEAALAGDILERTAISNPPGWMGG